MEPWVSQQQVSFSLTLGDVGATTLLCLPGRFYRDPLIS